MFLSGASQVAYTTSGSAKVSWVTEQLRGSCHFSPQFGAEDRLKSMEIHGKTIEKHS